MTRFKEKRRIEAAIQNGDKAELQWALWYCKMRLNLAGKEKQKTHMKGWQREIQLIEAALTEPEFDH